MRTPTYWDYLRLDGLLALQGGLEGDEASLLPDEVHFIVVHQVYELWFKLALRELRLARDALGRERVDEAAMPDVCHHLGRVNTVLRLAVQQFELVETLAPQDFLAFRDKLFPASGFQSFQMREIEILMGLKDGDRVQVGGADVTTHLERARNDTPAGNLAAARMAAVRAERTLLEVLDDWLHRTPIDGSSPSDRGDDEAVAAFATHWLAASDRYIDATEARARANGGDAGLAARFEAARLAARTFLNAEDQPPEARARRRRIRAAVLFIESYRSLPLLAWPRRLLDGFVDLEEQVVLFRQRHARMVERVIGRRIGTGGSGGVEYLDKTAAYRVFHDLWTVRTLLLPPDRNPPIQAAGRYGFQAAG
jgi:tryptophan 2,3-dioxygenase